MDKKSFIIHFHTLSKQIRAVKIIDAEIAPTFQPLQDAITNMQRSFLTNNHKIPQMDHFGIKQINETMKFWLSKEIFNVWIKKVLFGHC